MKITAMVAMVTAYGLFFVFLFAGVSEHVTIQQAIFCAVLLAAGLICLSNTEK